MPHIPTVPLSAGDVPDQRLVAVVDLPDRPANLECFVGYGGFPADVVPRQGVPRSPIFLVQVEWADTPANNGVEAFYLHARKKYWLLWRRTLDDCVDPWRWDWQLVGYCHRAGVPEKTAAVYLLLEFWRFTDDLGTALEDPSPFDWVNEVGLLDMANVTAIVGEL